MCCKKKSVTLKKTKQKKTLFPNMGDVTFLHPIKLQRQYRFVFKNTYNDEFFYNQLHNDYKLWLIIDKLKFCIGSIYLVMLEIFDYYFWLIKRVLNILFQQYTYISFLKWR